jgi:ribosomal protein uS17
MADEKKTTGKKKDAEVTEPVAEETAAPAEAEKTPVAEEPASEPEPVAEPAAEEPAAEEPATEEPVAEEPAPEEPAAEEPAAEELAAEEPASEEPVAEEPVAEEPAAATKPEPAAEAPAEAAAPAQPTAKPKRKRLPRSQRHKHSKPKRERPATRSAITRLPKPEHVRGRRQERRGVVVSNAMDKTIVVKVDTVKAHPKYKKVVRRSNRFHAHDEQNTAKVGDLVRIVETRPLSKTKNWRLAEVLEEAK